MKKLYVSLFSGTLRGGGIFAKCPTLIARTLCFCVLLAINLWAIPATAQTSNKKAHIVSGTVTDTSGNPIVGATIVSSKHAHIGTTTDSKGFFLLTNIESDDVLQVGFVGMKSKELPVGAQMRFDITLENDTEIDEVIVTGYQEISKHQVAGAVKQVKMDEIKLGASFSVNQMLAGQISGVNVIQTSGEPSATPKIRIRGTSSILGNKSPIWVLDGIILDDPVQVNYQDLTGDDAAYLIGNAIAGVNPSDIESITVLKDASATALYGVQAANGVIVVTTKRGEAGRTKIRYDGSFTLNERPSYRQLDVMNAAERITLSQEMLADHFEYSRLPDDIGYEALYMKYMNHGLTYDQFASEVSKMASRNTDWYDLVFRDAFSHNHTVSLTGGSERTYYYASVGYNNTPTTAIKGGSERFSANMKLNSWLTKKLYMGISISGYQNKNKGYSSMAGVNPNTYAQNTARTIPAYNDDGSYYYYKLAGYNSISANGSSIKEYPKYNILNELNETGAQGEVANLNLQLNLQYEFIKGLRYELLASMVHDNSKRFDYATDASTYIAKMRGWNLDFPYLTGDYTSQDWYQESPIPQGGILSASYNTNTSYTLRNTLRYNTQLKEKHTISAFVTSEIRSIPTTGSSSIWYGWQPERGLAIEPVFTDKYIENARNGQYNPTLTDRTTHYVSWLGSASYSYMDKWTINGNIRMDGSNSFGENPKYRFLPVWSVAGKYTLSNEPWLRDSKVLSQLAIRASYGVQGNVDQNTSPSLVIQIGSTDATTGLNQSHVSLLPNADLRWEKTQSYNVGLDFAFLGDLVTGTIDAYKKHGTDMIATTQVSSATGRSELKINSGVVDNAGVEVALGFHPLHTNNWDLYLNVNYSYNRNKLIKANSSAVVNNTSKISGTALIEGKPLGTLYSYNFAGLNHDTGYPVFYDKNGNATGMIPDDKSESGEKEVPNYSLYEDEIELVESGVMDPPHYGGFDFTLRWKSLRLSASFTYSAGAVGRLPGIYTDAYNAYDPAQNMRKEFITRWRQPGDELHTNIPVLYNYDNYQDLPRRDGILSDRDVIEGNNMYDYSTARIAKTNVLRMRSLGLSYYVPTHKLRSWGIESAMISLQATNLFFIADKAWGGMDPESGYAAVPTPRTYTLNVSLTF